MRGRDEKWPPHCITLPLLTNRTAYVLRSPGRTWYWEDWEMKRWSHTLRPLRASDKHSTALPFIIIHFQRHRLLVYLLKECAKKVARYRKCVTITNISRFRSHVTLCFLIRLNRNNLHSNHSPVKFQLGDAVNNSSQDMQQTCLHLFYVQVAHT